MSTRRWFLALTAGLAVLGPPSRGQSSASADEAQRLIASCRDAEARLGPDHAGLANRLNDLAVFYASAGRYPEAERALARALRIVERHPDGERDAAVCLKHLAIVSAGTGKADEAATRLEQAVRLLEGRVRADEPLLLDCLSDLAAVYIRSKRFADARLLLVRSLLTTEAHHGPNALATADALHGLGTVEHALGRYREAEPLLRRCVAIREARLGSDHPDVARGLVGLASLDYALGRYGEAETLYLGALRILRVHLGPDDPSVANGLRDLAWLYRATGRYPEAADAHRSALQALEARRGPDHLDVAFSLVGLADLYRQMGQYGKSEALQRRGLKILESRLGPQDRDVALGLYKLAMLCQAMGRTAEAEAMHRRGLAIRETRLGPDHPDVARSLVGLAESCEASAKADEAEALRRRALRILESRKGPGHPHVADVLADLAGGSAAAGRLPEAEQLHRRGLAIREAALGPDHPDLAASRIELAKLAAGCGRWDEAATEVDLARRLLRRHTARTLPALAEPEQLAFLSARDRPSLHLALSLALVRRDDPGIADLSAGWVLNGKGVAQEALARRTLMLRDADDPARGRDLRELLAVRARLAALRLTVAEPGHEAEHRRELDRLAARDRELTDRLGEFGRGRADDREMPQPWVEAATVRARLPARSALLEFARIDMVDPAETRRTGAARPARYVAWILPPAGADPVRIVDLGPAAAIDSCVDAVRAGLVPEVVARETGERGEREAELKLKERLRSLSSRVLDPLLPALNPAETWYIAADGALWLVPWAAAVLPDGRYAVEAHTIRHLVSGRDLVRPADIRSKVPAGRSMIMADPDFDLEPRAAREAMTRMLGTRAVPPSEPPVTASPLPVLGRVERLPGTRREAEAIRPRLAAYTGVAPVVYAGIWAQESVFKLARSPRVVVFSTHGFALDGAADGVARASGGGRSATIENPLLRCGLLLAGANRGDRASGGDDGVLTGLEVVGTDLRGTELVVLSACETALGAVHDGEGVSGLRQAFQLAGSQTVVASLWQVPDKETARLMTGFFDRLTVEPSRAMALRQAQLGQIRHRRDRHDGAAHPFYWAAFTLTGPEF
jgi:CHAT domain-containing protein/tetratricopeptide (TPR) repeat protein